MADITDGLSNTLILAECGDYTLDGGGTWTQPRYSWPYVSDVGRFTGLGAGVGASPPETSLKPQSRLPGGVFQSLSADGGVRCVSEGIAVELLQSLTEKWGRERFFGRQMQRPALKRIARVPTKNRSRPHFYRFSPEGRAEAGARSAGERVESSL